MNKNEFKLWAQGMKDAMAIYKQHIVCKMVEDKIKAEIETQSKATGVVAEKENDTFSKAFDEFFHMDFGWEEPPVKGKSVKTDLDWQSKFKKHFGNGPVKRTARK